MRAESPSDKHAKDRLRHALPIVLAACAVLLGAVAYRGALECEFVRWDDDYLVVDNPAIRSLDGESLVRMFDPRVDRSRYGSQYLPLSDLSYAVDYRIFGLSARAFHASGVVWHLLAVAFAFALVYRWQRQPWLALLAAMTLAVHPAGVEAVTWVSGRRTVIATALLLASAWSWLASREPIREPVARRRRRAAWWASLLLFVASCLTKQSAVLLPGILLVLDSTRARSGTSAGPGGWRRTALALAPHAALAVGFVVLHTWVGQREGSVTAHPGGFAGQAATALLGWAYSAKTFFWPDALRPLYAFTHDAMERRAVVAAGAVVLAAGAVAGHALRRRVPEVAPLLVAGSLLLAPSFAGAGTQAFAERYLYPALPFLGGAIAAGVLRVALEVNRARLIAMLFLAVTFGALTHATVQRNRDWRNDLSLWSSAVAVAPDNPTANAYLGRALLAAERPAEAERHLTRALELLPGRISRGPSVALAPLRFLAELYESQGRYEEAQATILRYTELDDSPGAFLLLGGFLARRGRTDEAIAVYSALAQRYPAFAGAAGDAVDPPRRRGD